MIRFPLDQTFCVLYPTHGLATPFGGRTQAMAFMERLFAFLNDIHRRSEKIKPKHRRIGHLKAFAPKYWPRYVDSFPVWLLLRISVSSRSSQTCVPIWDFLYSHRGTLSRLRDGADSLEHGCGLFRNRDHPNRPCSSTRKWIFGRTTKRPSQASENGEANASLPTRLTQRELEASVCSLKGAQMSNSRVSLTSVPIRLATSSIFSTSSA